MNHFEKRYDLDSEIKMEAQKHELCRCPKLLSKLLKLLSKLPSFKDIFETSQHLKFSSFLLFFLKEFEDSECPPGSIII